MRSGGYGEALETLVLPISKMWKGGYGEAQVLSVCGLLTIVLIIYWRWGKGNERFPPGPRGWPIIGNLGLLNHLPHQTFRELSKKYGPMVGLRLGQQAAVVVSSPGLAKEVLYTHDMVFANRPPHEFTSSLFYKNDIIFSSYGPQWRKQRKICILELFTARRLQELEYVRQEEMGAFLQRLQEESEEGTRAVNIGRSVGLMTSSLMMRLLQSRAISRVGDENLHDLIQQTEQECFPTIGDLIPFLSWLDFAKKRRMRRLHARIDKVLTAVLAERKQSASHHDDLLQALISKEVADEKGSSPPQDALTIKEIKSIMLDMLGAGIQATTLALEWAMAELLRNPHCLQRLQKEIDTVLGMKKQVSDADGARLSYLNCIVQVNPADVAKLSYLKCIVKEVLRLHPGAPLLLPRISTEECKVNGYILPANTLMFVNVWAIGRDEQVWPNANEFMPERFEGTDIDLKGQHYELLPFGSGKRTCLGLPLGMSVLEATLANLVNSFDWELPSGVTHTSMNMDERTGVTVNKATPVLAIPKPRVGSS